MGTSWRIVLGALSGIAAAVIWAVSLAIYQPFMQPDGFWTDPATGEAYPEIGSNNTYWPRDIRQLAILLAFMGVVLICRANARSILAAASGSAAGSGGPGARPDRRARRHHRGLARGWRSCRVRGDRRRCPVLFDGPARVRVHGPSFATLAAVSGTVAVLITTPWDEPVTNPDQVQVENALSLLKGGLVLMFVAVALALLPLARVLWMAPFAGLAALAAWPATATYGFLGMFGLIFLPVGAAAAVAAARDVSLPRLLGVVVACAFVMIPVYLTSTSSDQPSAAR